jgi:hypothetical protein
VTPQEFLAAVLPPPGYGLFCVCELTSTRKKHEFVPTLEEAQAKIENFNKKHFDTYFALATFESDRSREASNARWVQSFFVDIDCGIGHAYPTARDGATALANFITREPARVEFFYEDSTNVRSNQVTVRIEERVALPVYGNHYFVYGTFDAVS